MAYAKLVFSASATVQQKLKEIANVCTGGITSNTQLQFANTQQSIVISTEPAGWTTADANSALETGATATKNQYRLSAPCVDTSKTKYCELSALTVESVTPGSGANSQIVFNTRPAVGATTGFLWIPIGTGVSANTLVNPVYFFNSGGVFNGGFTTISYAPGRLSSTTTEYHISVTNRKLIVFSASGSLGPSIIMNLEFPENVQTTSANNLPFININMAIASTDSSPTGSTLILLPNFLSRSGGTGGSTIYRHAWFTNWYDSISKTRQTQLAGYAGTTFTGYLNPYYISVNPSLSVNSSGSSVYPLIEFIDVRYSRAEGIHNYSTLTDTFYTYRSSTYSASGDEITVGSDTYVTLTFGSSTANYKTICVKKA